MPVFWKKVPNPQLMPSGKNSAYPAVGDSNAIISMPTYEFIQEAAKKKKKTIRFHSDELQGNWKVPGSFLLAVFNSREYGREGVFVGTVYLML